MAPKFLSSNLYSLYTAYSLNKIWWKIGQNDYWFLWFRRYFSSIHSLGKFYYHNIINLDHTYLHNSNPFKVCATRLNKIPLEALPLPTKNKTGLLRFQHIFSAWSPSPAEHGTCDALGYVPASLFFWPGCTKTRVRVSDKNTQSPPYSCTVQVSAWKQSEHVFGNEVLMLKEIQQKTVYERT